jgi:prepilin-type N-terminal cleavage/methylation domain-containing protein/prepilin-type processing-associated H-X9-DG protein
MASTLQRADRSPRAFTLVELLVVIAVIATLVGLLLPSLASSREAARGVVCGSSTRQLASAVLMYGGDNKSLAPAGAPNFLANRTRWFGARSGGVGVFSSEGGTMSAYLETSGSLRACPSFAKRLEDLASRPAAGGGFERGCGGYGYNNAYIGVRRGADGAVLTDRTGERLERFLRPTTTLLFSDTAFAAGTEGEASVIEYSFAEPRWLPELDRSGGPAGQASRPDPSIHFRHGGRAAAAGAASGGTTNAGWLDGHVSSHNRTFWQSSGLYPADAALAGTGWFGNEDDNRLFSGN